MAQQRNYFLVLIVDRLAGLSVLDLPSEIDAFLTVRITLLSIIAFSYLFNCLFNINNWIVALIEEQYSAVERLTYFPYQ